MTFENIFKMKYFFFTNHEMKFFSFFQNFYATFHLHFEREVFFITFLTPFHKYPFKKFRILQKDPDPATLSYLTIHKNRTKIFLVFLLTVRPA